MDDLIGRSVTLGRAKEQDRTAIVRLWTDPLVRQFLGGPVDHERAEATADKILSATGNTWTWSVRLHTTGEFIGLFSLDKHHDGVEIEVSFLLLPEFHGRGFASDALAVLLRHASSSLSLPRVVAETQTRNYASCRLLESQGFTRDRELSRFGERQTIYIKTLELDQHLTVGDACM